MNHTKSLMAALVFASASFASSAVLADDITTGPTAVNLVDGSGFFGDAFAMNNMSDTFADHFTFNVTGSAANLDAIVSSISRTASTGLDITGIALYNAANALVSNGSMMHTGATDVWTVSSDNLAVGSYYVQISGTMVSNTSGAFGGSMMLAPVPEPETYGMMLAGLGLVGFMARRRKSKQA